MKLTEAVLQLRLRALLRVTVHRDPVICKALRWCYGVGRRAWFFEVRCFLSKQHQQHNHATLAEFWGASEDASDDTHSTNHSPQSEVTFHVTRKELA